MCVRSEANTAIPKNGQEVKANDVDGSTAPRTFPLAWVLVNLGIVICLGFLLGRAQVATSGLDSATAHNMMAGDAISAASNSNESLHSIEGRQIQQLPGPWRRVHNDKDEKHASNSRKYEQYLVHPALLAHENPERVAVLLLSGNIDDINYPCAGNTILDELLNLHSSVIKHLAVITVDLEAQAPATSHQSTTFSQCNNINREKYQDRNSIEIEWVHLSSDDLRNKDDNFSTLTLTETVSNMDVMIVEHRHVFSRLRTRMLSDLINQESGLMAFPVHTFAITNEERRSGFGTTGLQGIIKDLFDAGDDDGYVDDEGEEFDDEEEDVDHEGFKVIIDYQVRTSSYKGMQNFAIAFTNRASKALWYQNEAFWNLRIHKRQAFGKSSGNKGRDSIMAWSSSSFDSTTMETIKYPTIASEKEFCRFVPEICEESRQNNAAALDPNRGNVGHEDLYIAPSTVGEKAGRGVFTKVNITADTYVDLGKTCRPVLASWMANKLIWDSIHQHRIFSVSSLPLFQYFDGYGFTIEAIGRPEMGVDASVLTFANHGCNFTYNIGDILNISETTADINSPPAIIYEYDAYNPMQERYMTKDAWVSVAFKPIAAGEEILDNYFSYSGTEKEYEVQIHELRIQCAGIAGEIERFQQSKKGGTSNNTDRALRSPNALDSEL